MQQIIAVLNAKPERVNEAAQLYNTFIAQNENGVLSLDDLVNAKSLIAHAIEEGHQEVSQVEKIRRSLVSIEAIPSRNIPIGF
ncbi:MAG: hypothetical protein JST84_04665 [Acidobacteria bacterium]|nr:hypothetical protein [Acidobacteriota bacterium]